LPPDAGRHARPQVATSNVRTLHPRWQVIHERRIVSSFCRFTSSFHVDKRRK
jgi:hypothetical protein